ncbi:MAG: FtsX-like permease family protein [Treponema sp.]|jgi:putative ABC transport system permease protein|nr:FtsX-like permease family protein [Treponema sp.]
MFWRMVSCALLRQRGKMLMIAFTIALGASLATAMLNVMFDVGDKVNQELKTYGANITVMPRGASILGDLYDMAPEETAGEEDAASEAYLQEPEIGNIKTIFWAFNIVDFAPFLNTRAFLKDTNGVAGAGKTETVKVTGTWFNRHIVLPTGEELDTGMGNMKNWWEISGLWEEADDTLMAGRNAAEKLGIAQGDRVTLEGSAGKESFSVTAVFYSGSAEDDALYISLDAAQRLSGKQNKVSGIEVSALTTPDNELSRRASQDPNSLSIKEWETWYCTAYVSAICYQIDEVISGAVSKPVRQIAESEGAILKKTQILMLLITILSLAGSALGISNLVSAVVMERSAEIGLLKAVGARNEAVSALILMEIVITGIFGGIAGYGAGLGFAELIGQSVFGSSISIKPAVIPLVAILALLVTMAGSLPAMRLVLRLRPAETLHGR